MNDDVDFKALTLAMQRARQQGRDDQLDAKLRHEKWEEAARFASSCCQSAALQLKPWEPAPCDVNDPEHPSDRERAAAKLLRRMLRAGISRYHPDPNAAIAAAGAIRK